MNIVEHLGEPIGVDGRTVVFVQDYVGVRADIFDAPVLLEEATAYHPAIWADETEVRRIREEHGDVAVHGFWQTAFANGLVGSDPLYVSIGGTTGLYLLRSGENVHSGEIIPGTFQLVGNQELSAHGGTRLTLDASRIRLPAIPARTAAELAAVRRAVLRKDVIRVASLVGAVGVGALVLDFLAGSWQRAGLEDAKERLAEVRGVSTDLAQLRQARLAEWPNQFAQLAPYLVLADADPYLTLENGDTQSEIGPSGGVLMSTWEVADRVAPLGVFRLQRLRTGKTLVTWGAR